MSAYEAGGARHVRVTLLDSKAMRVVVACVVLCLIAGVAFLAGERQGNRTTVLTGIAYTGMNEATVTVAGWSYGIPGDVTWFDSQGTEHAGGWPSCLRGVGRHVRITFAAVPVTAQGDSWRQVLWVGCRS